MPHRFTERDDIEAGFAEVFEARIVPMLERHEAERVERRRKAVQGMAATGGLGAAGLGAGIGFGEEVVGAVAAAFGGIGAMGARGYHESQWKAALADEIVPVLCEHLGDMRYGEQRVSVAPFTRLGVVPDHTDARLANPVVGRHHEAVWAMTEATLIRRRRTGRRRSQTVFEGVLIQISVLNPAPRIFFARDRGGLVNRLSETFSSARAGLERLHLPDPEFERVYEVYTDDVEAARAYIGPPLVEGLKALAAAEGRAGDHIACAFEGDWFHLALPRRRGFLSLGSLFRPVDDIEEDLHRALADLALPRRIIDVFSGA
jgi:hypothetical protein